MPRIEFHDDETDEDVFDENTFLPAFEKDLANAVASVVISSGTLTGNAVNRLSHPLHELTRRGVRCCIFIEEIEGWHQRTNPDLPTNSEIKRFEKAVKHLEALGMHVNLRPYWHPKMAVIDGCIFWDGSLNATSWRRRVERAPRSAKPIKALLAVRRFKLDRCRICQQLREESAAAKSAGFILKPDNVAVLMKELRKAAALSRTELAVSTGLSVSTISEIERGKYVPQFDTLVIIWNALNHELVSFPSDATRLLEQIARLSPITEPLRRSP